MPNYFLDTSAVAKRYHKESGSEYIDRILEQSVSRSLISNLSILELESVLAIKRRTGEINQQSLEIARRRFRADLARQRLIVPRPLMRAISRAPGSYWFDTEWRKDSGHSIHCNWPWLWTCTDWGTLPCLSRPTKDSAASRPWLAVQP